MRHVAVLAAFGQLRSLSQPEPCVPRRPVYLSKLPAAELAWLASHRPKPPMTYSATLVSYAPHTGTHKGLGTGTADQAITNDAITS